MLSKCCDQILGIDRKLQLFWRLHGNASLSETNLLSVGHASSSWHWKC